MHALLEVLEKFSRAASNRLFRYRLDQCQHVLRPMIDLMHEQFDRLFLPLSLGEIVKVAYDTRTAIR